MRIDKLLVLIVALSPAVVAPAAAAPGGEPGDEAAFSYDSVQVFYATNRAVLRQTATGPEYSGRRGSMVYGSLVVTIPRGHEPGRLETARFMGVPTPESPHNHVLLRRVRPLTHEAMLQGLRQRVAASPSRHLLVFVHGYNVSFEEAARRVAQLWWDMKFPGPVLLYSWPSDGTEAAYVSDRNDAEAAVTGFAEVLSSLSAQTGASSLHLLAHSMGNVVVMNALDELAKRGNRRLLDEVVLVAPDVDQTVFQRLAPAVIRSASRVSLYASSHDRALDLSRKLGGDYPRAGQAGSSLLLMKDVQTIDASGVEADFLGHSYFVAEPMMADLLLVMRDGYQPRQRGLETRVRRGGEYWRFPPRRRRR